MCIHFNPLAPCGARRLQPNNATRRYVISIHSPRAGRDTLARKSRTCSCDFNPLAPCGARRPRAQRAFGQKADFNPLAPCGARRRTRRRWTLRYHFNPLAPCGARLGNATAGGGFRNISIHSPRAGRDTIPATAAGCAFIISIHSPRAGRDPGEACQLQGQKQFQSTRPVRGETFPTKLQCRPRRNFNPLAPCGARQAKPLERALKQARFQSTRPVRGETSAI